jgi:hypothetical protein
MLLFEVPKSANSFSAEERLLCIKNSNKFEETTTASLGIPAMLEQISSSAVNFEVLAPNSLVELSNASHLQLLCHVFCLELLSDASTDTQHLLAAEHVGTIRASNLNCHLDVKHKMPSVGR